MTQWVDALGGAAVAGAIIAAVVSAATVFLKWRWDVRKLKLATLEAELSGIYGPVAFLLSQNKVIFAHTAEVSAAAERNSKQSGSDSDEITVVIKVNNTYAALAAENNAKIIQLVQQNYHLIDDGDLAVCHEAALDHVRLGVEGSAGRDKPPLSFMIAQTMDKPILYMRPEFHKKMLATFVSKQATARKLRGA
jgi:hypothetical protein